MGIAYTLLSHEQVLRIAPMSPPRRYALDGVGALRSLEGLGVSEARRELPRLRERFFSSYAEPFVPCYQILHCPCAAEDVRFSAAPVR